MSGMLTRLGLCVMWLLQRLPFPALVSVGRGLGRLLLVTVLYDHFGPLYWTVTLFAFAYSLFLYLHGRLRPDEGKSKWSGHFFYDYFMGTALNPRTGSFDHKLFNEARPGLILWVAINLSIAAAKWLYLWSSPQVPLDKEFSYGHEGTQVEIIL